MKNFSVSCIAFQVPYILAEIEVMQECEKALESAESAIKSGEQAIRQLKEFFGEQGHPGNFEEKGYPFKQLN